MITKNTPLLEVFEKEPELSEQLLTPLLGGHCAGCPLAKEENLEEALTAHGLEPREIEKIIEKLNQKKD